MVRGAQELTARARPRPKHCRRAAVLTAALVTAAGPLGACSSDDDDDAAPRATSAPGSTTAPSAPTPAGEPEVATYRVPPGSAPHDVAPAPDGSVWYTAQSAGALGRLDPSTAATRHVRLGDRSAAASPSPPAATSTTPLSPATTSPESTPAPARPR